MKNVLIIGGGKKAKMLLNMFKFNDVIATKKMRFIGIYDKMLKKPTFKSKIKFFNKKDDLKNLIKKADYFLLAIGNNLIRKKYSELLYKYNIKSYEPDTKNEKEFRKFTYYFNYFMYK